MSKFKIGDKVRIVNYGHAIWHTGPGEDIKGLPVLKKEGQTTWIDINPGLVGKETIITGFSNGRYSTELVSWLEEEQLELII